MPDEFQALKKERCVEIIKACNGSGVPKQQSPAMLDFFDRLQGRRMPSLFFLMPYRQSVPAPYPPLSAWDTP